MVAHIQTREAKISYGAPTGCYSAKIRSEVRFDASSLSLKDTSLWLVLPSIGIRLRLYHRQVVGR